MHKRRNPLAYVLGAALITLPFDFYCYLLPFNPLGVAIILCKVTFLVLYARRSRFAWHLAFSVTAAVVPLFPSDDSSGYRARSSASEPPPF
jgi:hypothetical protein